jgi:hypothetical protein
VRANEQNEQRLLPAKIVATDRFAAHNIGKHKIRRNGAKLEHRGFSKCHGFSPSMIRRAIDA